MSRVSLRLPTVADGPILIQANRESRECHSPWVEPFIDDAGFQTWLERSYLPTNPGFLATEIATGAVVGIVNLNNIIQGAFHNAFLGFYGMKAMSGRGLMTEAVSLAAERAFNDYGLHRLEANIQPGNMHSIALVKRLNFRREGFSPRYLKVYGEWRDHERWALLADDIARA